MKSDTYYFFSSTRFAIFFADALFLLVPRPLHPADLLFTVTVLPRRLLVAREVVPAGVGQGHRCGRAVEGGGGGGLVFLRSISGAGGSVRTAGGGGGAPGDGGGSGRTVSPSGEPSLAAWLHQELILA